MKKLLFLLPLFALSGCGTIQELNDLVNESTYSIDQNTDQIDRSTEVIYRNGELIEASSRAIRENHKQLEIELSH